MFFPIKKWRLTILGVTIILLGFVWEATYPGYYDSKNPHYVAWKLHLLPMDPHRATSTMSLDPARDSLVSGLTQSQLEHRFGFVLTPRQVRPYLRDYCAASRPGAEVLFLNSNDLMVVMRNGRAVELVTCKG